MLTAREVWVLKLVARGLSTTRSPRVMDLAVSSVKTHIGHLLAKLQFTDRVHLVVFAYEHELVRAGIPETTPEPGNGASAATRTLPPCARGRQRRG